MKILIYRLGSLGDTLVALPCFHAIRRVYPTAQITLLTNIPINLKARASGDLLSQTGLVDTFLSYPIGLRNPWALIRIMNEISAERFDIVIDLANARGRFKSLRDLIFFSLCGCSEIVGIPWKFRDLNCVLESDGTGLYEAEAKRLARRIAGLVSPIDLRDRTLWSLNLKKEEMAHVDGILAGASMPDRFIVASVGTKVEAKDWGQDNWQSLLHQLGKAHPRLGLVMIGSEDEIVRSESCVETWSGPRINLAGKLKARESAALLSRAQLFVGHDSGPMHLAAAVNTPCVAIFSARNLPGRWFPSGDNHQILYHRTECFGCGLERCVIERKRCILSITVAEVMGGIENCLHLRAPAQ